MPDLITHFAGAYLVNRGWKIGRGAVIFYLGAMLPDLITRPFHIIWPSLLPATLGLHSPAGAFLACYLISLLFRSDQRSPVFWLLLSGSLLHFLMDTAQKHLTGGYLWLFPFSSRRITVGFIWPEDSIRFLPITLLILALVFAVSRWREWRRRSIAESQPPE